MPDDAAGRGDELDRVADDGAFARLADSMGRFNDAMGEALIGADVAEAKERVGELVEALLREGEDARIELNVHPRSRRRIGKPVVVIVRKPKAA